MGDAQVFAQGVEDYRQSRFFEAHERWEDLWRASKDDAERHALQGLVQLAASMHKSAQGAEAGHAKLWAKARTHLRAAARVLPVVYGVELAPLVERLSGAPEPHARKPALKTPRPRFGVVYLHGFGSSPHSPKGQAVCGALREAGISVAAPSLAEPEEFFDFTVTRSLGRARHCLFERTLLVGSSLGGWTSALLALTDPRVVEMVLLCPAFRFPERWFSPERRQELSRWRAKGSLPFDVGHPPRSLPLGVGFLEDAERHDGAPRLDLPVSVYHGSRDDVVPLSDVRAVTDAHPHVRLTILDDDHGLRESLSQIAQHAVQRARSLASQT